jgi:CPA2 family monovalent cation:H+ antiporter-2/glutathione-regulated potassium-efflux system protein KefB
MSTTLYIVDIIILLATAVIVVPVFQRIGLGAVLGFLVAGALVGPWGLGFIVAVDEIRHLAEFGVVFLLFIIGIELKPSRLWVMRRSVFGLGTAQVLITGAVMTGAAMALGMPTRTALVAGFGLALSSTAFGMQILSEKGELGTAHGHASFAILLLQDLAIVPLIALLPLLAQKELTILQDVELAAAESVLIIVGVFVLGRALLRPVLQLVAGSRRNPEIFTATAILLVLGAAWLTEQAGLSMALGAFLGGLLLADSPFRHQIMADIQPFRGLLLGLFFMGVGMSINFGLLGEKGSEVAGLLAGLLVIKSVLLWTLCRLAGRSHRDSVQVALLLAQAGEFGFVIFGIADMLGLIQTEVYELLLVVIALSMATTPLLARLGPLLGGTSKTEPPADDHPSKPFPELSDHVIVAGFGRFGNHLARILAKARVNYLALDTNPARVAKAQALGHQVFFGDASRTDVLRAAGAAHASMLVLALDRIESIAHAVSTVREAFPDLPIYARAWDAKVAARLRTMGVNYAIPETMEASLRLAKDVLCDSGVSPEVAGRLVDEARGWETSKGTKAPGPDPRLGFKDILLMLTPHTDETAVLAHAAALAEDNGAALTVVEVLTEDRSGSEHGVYSPEELEDEMTEGRRRRLETLVADLREGIDVQTKVLVGKPHEEITRDVVSNGRDLVLKVAEGRRGLRERVFGDRDTRLVKVCPCPVLLIRSLPPKPYRHRRILAGVYRDENPAGHHDDRKEVNREILEQAAWLAAAQFAELHVVHAWEAYGEQDLRSGRSPFQFDANAYVEREHTRNEEALNTCLSEVRELISDTMRPAFRPVCHVVKGSRHDEILRLADRLGADLVVVGAAARSRLTSLVVESAAEAIAKRLDCSVLVVKPPGFVTPVVIEES